MKSYVITGKYSRSLRFSELFGKLIIALMLAFFIIEAASDRG